MCFIHLRAPGTQPGREMADNVAQRAKNSKILLILCKTGAYRIFLSMGWYPQLFMADSISTTCVLITLGQ